MLVERRRDRRGESMRNPHRSSKESQENAVRFGAAVIGVLIVGAVSWFVGGGGIGMILGSLVLGVVVAARAISLPLAIAIITIWTFFTWLVGGVVVEAYFLASPVAGWILAGISLTPIVIGCICWNYFRLTAGRRGSPMAPTQDGHILSALAGPVLVVMVVVGTMLRYGNAGMAWALGGDARNQVDQFVIAHFQTPAAGSLVAAITPRSMLNSMLTVFTSSPFSTTSLATDQVLLTMRGLTAITTLAVVLSCLSAGTLMIQIARGRGWGIHWAIVAASLIPLTGIGVGIGIYGGFVTALLVIPLITFSLVLATAIHQGRLPQSVVVLLLVTMGATVIIVLLLWSFIAPTAIALLGLGTITSWRILSRRLRLMFIAVVIGGVVVLAPLIKDWGREVLESNIFAWGGSITAPSATILLVTPLAVFAMVLATGTHRPAHFLWAYSIGLVSSLMMIAVIVYEPAGPPVWSYYGSKVAWIWIAASLPLAVLPIAQFAGCFASSNEAKNVNADEVNGPLRRQFSMGFALLLTLVIAQSLSPIASPFIDYSLVPFMARSPIGGGFTAPTPQALDVVLKSANRGEPVVVWSVNDPGNDRLSNFLLGLYPVNKNDQFQIWAYDQTEDISTLCTLLSRNPSRVVITRYAGLREVIIHDCGIPNPSVEMAP